MVDISVPDQIEEEIASEDALPGIPIVSDEEIPPDQGDAGKGGHPDAGEEPGDEEAIGPQGQITPIQRAQCQKLIARGCGLMLANPGAVHYTMGPQRWSGISNDRRISRNEFPRDSDCSSSATWLLWNALRVHLGWGDVVNGANWNAGYTGTMLGHGRAVKENSAQVGDCAFYGAPGSSGSHVVVCLGGGVAFSHGSKQGPFKLGLHYRSDLMGFRRYF